MKRTMIVTSCNRTMQDNTRKCISNLINLGAGYIAQSGSPDVALARNMALSHALDAIESYNSAFAKAREGNSRGDGGAREDFDTILMVDDDMEFSQEQAQELVDYTREWHFAASAMYATTLGTLAGARFETPPGEKQLWLAGLGFLAIPAKQLVALAERSRAFEHQDKRMREFTWTYALNGFWSSEDFTLCRRLGGVHMLPMPVGHLKTLPIYPDEVTVGKVRDGLSFRGELDPKILAHLTEADLVAQRPEL